MGQVTVGRSCYVGLARFQQLQSYYRACNCSNFFHTLNVLSSSIFHMTMVMVLRNSVMTEPTCFASILRFAADLRVRGTGRVCCEHAKRYPLIVRFLGRWGPWVHIALPRHGLICPWRPRISNVPHWVACILIPSLLPHQQLQLWACQPWEPSCPWDYCLNGAKVVRDVRVCQP